MYFFFIYFLIHLEGSIFSLEKLIGAFFKAKPCKVFQFIRCQTTENG